MNDPLAATPDRDLIFVIDDDVCIREALDGLFRSVGLPVLTFGSIADFLRARLPVLSGCIVLDVRLPGLSGLDFQAQVADFDIRLPIVFMTGHGDIPMTVRAMKAGAVDFLAKPFRDQDMLDAVATALERRRRSKELEAQMAEARWRFDTLSAREREVMLHVVSGRMNKQIAHALGLSEITIKIYRGNVMKKMNVQSLPDLVRKCETLKIETGVYPAKGDAGFAARQAPPQ